MADEDGDRCRLLANREAGELRRLRRSALGGVEGGVFFGFLDQLDYIVSNFMFPVAGIGLSLFVGWRMPDEIRHDHFLSGSKFKVFYNIWLTLLRFVVPVGISVVFLNAIGVV